MTYIKIMLTALVIATAALAIAMFRQVPAAGPQPYPAEIMLDIPVGYINVESATFDEAIAALSRRTGLRMSVDWPALQRAGISQRAKTSFSFGGSTLAAMLDQMGNFYRDKPDAPDGHMDYCMADDGSLRISANSDIVLRTRIYDVHDLLTDEYWGEISERTNAQAQSERLNTLVNFLNMRVSGNSQGTFSPPDAKQSSASIDGMAGRLMVVAQPANQHEIERVLAWLRRMR